MTDHNLRRASARAARTRARGFALQALYQVMVGGNPADEVDIFTRDLSGFNKADAVHFDALLHGCAAQTEALDALILPVLDRKLSELSPIEHAVLWIGAYELQHCVDIPWRVVLNECIDLAKEFGGTDGHKYVNAVLNQLAQQLRLTEVQSERSKPTASVAANDDSTATD
jgi:N utilization substance protein B